MADITQLAEERQRTLDTKRASGEDFGHDVLAKALFWMWDAMDRAAMGFFLVGQTGISARDNTLLSGNHLDVGIRKVEWISGGRSILDSFANKPDWEDERKAQYIFEGVPINVWIYEDEGALKQMQPIMYQNDNFNLPNPFDKFETVPIDEPVKPNVEEAPIAPVEPSKASGTPLPFSEHVNLPTTDNKNL